MPQNLTCKVSFLSAASFRHLFMGNTPISALHCVHCWPQLRAMFVKMVVKIFFTTMSADSFNFNCVIICTVVFKIYVLKVFMSSYMSWQNYVFANSVMCPATISSLDVFQQLLLFHTCLSLSVVHCISMYSISTWYKTLHFLESTW